MLLSHSGEKPLKCKYCSYATGDPFRMRRHIVTHTGEKPYKCDECGHPFTQKGSLNMHK